jgi:hypothetical protein
MRIVLAMLLLFPALGFAADAARKPEVYKWVDDKGVVHYTDKPPTSDATPVKLPPLQTYKRGTTPDLNRFERAGPAGATVPAGPNIQVVTPAREETFHGSERTVPVAVIVTPGLQPEQKLLYMLDGKPLGSPTDDTSYALTEVDRGQHSVAVAVLDGSGQELSRSVPVTF